MLYRRLSAGRNPTTRSLMTSHIVLRTTTGAVNMNTLLPALYLRNSITRFTNLKFEVQAAGGGGGGNGAAGGLCYGAPAPEATGGAGSEGKAGAFFRVIVSTSVFQDATANTNLGGIASGAEQPGDGQVGRNPNKGGGGGARGRTGINTTVNLGTFSPTTINVVGGAAGSGGGGGGRRRGNFPPGGSNLATPGGPAGASVGITGPTSAGSTVDPGRGGTGGASGGSYGCYNISLGGGQPGFDAPAAKASTVVPTVGTFLYPSPQGSINPPNHGVTIFTANNYGRGGAVGASSGGASAILITGSTIRI